MLWTLSLKNVFRNKTRSAILMAAIASGLAGGILAMGIAFGMMDQFVASAIETRLSHIQFHAPEFPENMDLNRTIPGGMEVCESLRALPGIRAAGRVKTQGMISSPRAGAGVVISGIDPAREKEVTDMASRVREGSYFQSGKRNPVLVSHSLCEKLGVRLGSKIVLTFQDAQNAITAGAFRIAGIFRSENSLFDESNVFVLRETLARLTGLPARVHEIAVRLDRPADIENTAAKLHAGYPGLKIRTWKQIEPELEYLHEINKLMMFIFMGIILFALAFGIVNTMLMVVLERTRELGMLVALGMTRRKVFAMIVLETVFLSAAGALFGFLIGIAAVNGLGETGIDLGYFAEGLSSYGISHIVHPRLRAGDYPGLACLVAGTALLSSIYPAARALRINPARAVRMT